MGIKPSETLCPVCTNIFKQPTRKQGGGVRSIYCSPKCRSLDWVRGNGAKRKATILKFDFNLLNREEKKRKSRLQRYKKYSITEEEFLVQLRRQNNRCYGCIKEIDSTSAMIDHDHSTGKVRGLLCTQCNWGLGHLKDNKETLYRLSAYLNYDLKKFGIYLIGSLRNPLVPKVAEVLRKQEFHVWDEWFSAGPEADDWFQKYHEALGISFQEALESNVAQHIFYFDKAHLDLCDCGVLVYPAGKSGHLELGYMAGMGKKTYILLDKEPERYEIMPQFATKVCTSIEELVEMLKREYNT